MLTSVLQRAAGALAWRWRLLSDEMKIACRRLVKPTVQAHGIVVPLGNHLSPEVLQALDHQTYEQCERGLLEEYLTADDRVMELGAGIGFISALCARKVGSSNVETYEANPKLQRPIRQLYSLNGVNPALNFCILGPQPGTRLFHLHRNFVCSTTEGLSKGRQSVNVLVRSFREEMDRVRPSFLIVDIEGGEFDLLMDQELPTVRTLLLEVHPAVLGESRIASLRGWFYSIGFERKAVNGDVEVYQRK